MELLEVLSLILGDPLDSISGLQANDVDRSKQLEWVKSMRKQFSPPGLLTPEGEINQDYFKPTQVPILKPNDSLTFSNQVRLTGTMCEREEGNT
jgi:hypothetical protein